MSLGAGFSAAGFSPAGTGDLDLAPAPATDIMVDEKGVQQSARRIDPATGQYVLGPSGRIQGMPRARQLVLLRIKTVLNSSSVAGLGLEQASGDRDQNATRRIQNQLSAALADLVTAKLIAILSITAATETPTRIRGALRWKDLTTSQEFTEPL